MFLASQVVKVIFFVEPVTPCKGPFDQCPISHPKILRILTKYFTCCRPVGKIILPQDLVSDGQSRALMTRPFGSSKGISAKNPRIMLRLSH